MTLNPKIPQKFTYKIPRNRFYFHLSRLQICSIWPSIFHQLAPLLLPLIHYPASHENWKLPQRSIFNLLKPDPCTHEIQPLCHSKWAPHGKPLPSNVVYYQNWPHQSPISIKKNQEIRKPTVRLFDTNGPQALINAFPWTSILTQIPSHHLKTENQKQKEQEFYKVPPKHIWSHYH